MLYFVEEVLDDIYGLELVSLCNKSFVEEGFENFDKREVFFLRKSFFDESKKHT